MTSFFDMIGPEIPVMIIILLLVLMQRGVTPRASLLIKAPPEQVFAVIDLYDGKQENWGQTKTEARLIDTARGIFEKVYVTSMAQGRAQRVSALFSIARREPGRYLEIAREGLEGKSTARELLRQVYELTPEKDGTRLTVTYHWGVRMALAQLTARADLWGGLYRIKALVERGVPDDRPYQLFSLGIAVLTGLVSFVAFAWILGLSTAFFVIVALAFHEFGHLLAYVLMGQPWGRIIFLPFLGAMAMPRLPFESQGEVIFAALMGPGLSVLLALACALGIYWLPAYTEQFFWLGFITVVLNLSNLLPVEPLDGGVALRSIMHWLMGRFARFGLMAAGLIIFLTGLFLQQILFILIGGIAIYANMKVRTIDPGLARLSLLQVCISLFGYITLIASYAALMVYFSGETAVILLQQA